MEISQVDSVQEDVTKNETPTESSKSPEEMVGSAQDASTENIKQTLDEVTTQSSVTKSENDDDGMVGMALPSANKAEQIDAVQTITESGVQTDEKVSAPLEPQTSEGDSQTPVDKKVRLNMIKFEKNEFKIIGFLFFRW